MRLKVLLIVTALVVMAGTVSISREDPEFSEWKLKFGKVYKSAEEEAQRKMIWTETREMVLEHNKLAAQGKKTYTLGLNQFSDLTNEELSKIC